MKNNTNTAEAKPTRDKIYYFDYLRIASILAVLCIHIIACDFYISDVHSTSFFILVLWDCFLYWCVPILVMISGALFLNPARVVTLKKLYGYNVLRILVAFIFWSAVYAIYLFINGFGVTEAVKSFLSGYYHMWYMYLIASLYMLVPLLRKISECRQTCKYTLILLFCTAFIIPQILAILVNLPIPGLTGLFHSLQQSYLNLMKYIPNGYIFYFLLGDYLYRNEFSHSVRKWIYWLGIFAAVFSISLTLWLSKRTGTPNELLMEEISVNIAILSTAVFLFGKYKMSKIHMNPFTQKCITHISKCSFGIYLVHCLVILFLQETGIIIQHSLNTISIPLLTILVFIISYLISAAIQKIPVLNKWIV